MEADVGAMEGDTLAPAVGAAVVRNVGAMEGDTLAPAVGAVVVRNVGAMEGVTLALRVGSTVGFTGTGIAPVGLVVG